jgi:hypothetical protein
MDKETFKQKLEELVLESGFGHKQALDDTLSGTRSYTYISDELELTVLVYEDVPESAE